MSIIGPDYNATQHRKEKEKHIFVKTLTLKVLFEAAAHKTISEQGPLVAVLGLSVISHNLPQQRLSYTDILHFHF